MFVTFPHHSCDDSRVSSACNAPPYECHFFPQKLGQANKQGKKTELMPGNIFTHVPQFLD